MKQRPQQGMSQKSAAVTLLVPVPRVVQLHVDSL
jgi:hypothetical protein